MDGPAGEVPGAGVPAAGTVAEGGVTAAAGDDGVGETAVPTPSFTTLSELEQATAKSNNTRSADETVIDNKECLRFNSIQTPIFF